MVISYLTLPTPVKKYLSRQQNLGIAKGKPCGRAVSRPNLCACVLVLLLVSSGCYITIDVPHLLLGALVVVMDCQASYRQSQVEGGPNLECPCIAYQRG